VILTLLYSKKVRMAKSFDLGLKPRQPSHPPRLWSRAIPWGSLHEALEDLERASERGEALLGGPVKDGRMLRGESRANRVDNAAPVDLLRLDFDGLPAGASGLAPVPAAACSSSAPGDALKAVLGSLGAGRAPGLAHWSASMGVRAGLRAHVLLPLGPPRAPEAVKRWMQDANLGPLRAFQRLTDSGTGVSWALDTALASPSQLLYLGDPSFEDPAADPFAGRSRWFRVGDAGAPPFSLPDPDSATPWRERRAGLLAALRAAKGLPPLPADPKTRKSRWQTVVVVDPALTAQVSVSELWLDGDWIRANVNGGDSCAYWAHASNPKLLFSFKPDEPVWRLEDVCPEDLWRHVEELRAEWGHSKRQRSERPSEELERRDGALVMGVDADSGRYFVWKDGDAELSSPRWLSRVGAMDVYMARSGARQRPTFVPDWRVVYDPWGPRFDLAARVLNTYSPPDVEPAEGECPAVDALFAHVVPDPSSREHLLDWLAWLSCRREKPNTAVVLQGFLGTGKNLLVEEVFFPLVGGSNAMTLGLPALVGPYNDFLARLLLIHVEEIDMGSLARSERGKAMASLRSIVTGQRMAMRPIYGAWSERDVKAALVMSTNRQVPLAVDSGERRVNFMPRQETPLHETEILAGGVEALKARIAAELPAFAAALAARPVDRDRLARPLDNPARREAIEEAVPRHELAAKAVSEGDGDWFLAEWEDREPSSGAPFADASSMSRPRLAVWGFLGELVACAGAGADHFVAVPVWQLVFKWLCEWPDGKRLGWLVKRWGVEFDAVRRVGGVPRRGCEVRWTVSPARLEAWTAKFAEASPASAPRLELIEGGKGGTGPGSAAPDP